MSPPHPRRPLSGGRRGRFCPGNAVGVHHPHENYHNTSRSVTATALFLSCCFIIYQSDVAPPSSSWMIYVNAFPIIAQPHQRRRPTTTLQYSRNDACSWPGIGSIRNNSSVRSHHRYIPSCRAHPTPSTTRRRQQQLYPTVQHMIDPAFSMDPTATITATTSVIQSSTSMLISSLQDSLNLYLPFSELGRELSQSLDIGSNLSRNVGNIPETTTNIVLDSLGYDILVFLSASVFVTPICRTIQITPILGYLIIGAILGPHGFDVFANTKADIELGDFGILFLLFSEGLEVTRPRLRKLVNFLPLGLAQISLVTGVLSAAFVTGVPELLGQFVPLDQTLMDIHRPAAAIVLAFAGALSTSAFIFPVLKERGWEDEESGEAATSILLLQDLLVAPLLVLLPLLVSETSTDFSTFGYLTIKATFGFGAIMYGASFVLQRLFALVAQTQSTETFVALCLLVAAGMGTIAKFFGLTDTAGAFAAGVVRQFVDFYGRFHHLVSSHQPLVLTLLHIFITAFLASKLLANTNYRAQIQADILPFKGILLGIFFMDAGSTFDSELVLSEWPTIVVGAVSLLVLKAVTLGAATRVPRWMEPNRLSLADGVRVSLLLSGGGEFAFVVLALANKLSVIPQELSAILTAIILITMGVTPLLGQLAATLSEPLVNFSDVEVKTNGVNGVDDVTIPYTVSSDAIVVCGYGEVGQSLVQVLSDEVSIVKSSKLHAHDGDAVKIVAFDTDPVFADDVLKPSSLSIAMFGDGANAEVIRSSGIRNPTAIFVAYEDHSRAVSATARLRASFGTSTPIFARAASRAEVLSLTSAGATQVVVEADELARAAPALVQGIWSGNLDQDYVQSEARVREAAAAAAGISLSEVDQLLELFSGMDSNMSGVVTVKELERVLERSTNWIATDDEIEQFDHWIETTLRDLDPIDVIEFCRLYGRAPDYVRRAFGITT